MNTAYAQQGAPPHSHDIHPHARTSIANINDPTYRTAPPPGPPSQPYAHPNTMPLPQQSQINSAYGDPYNPLAVSRAPMPDQLHGAEGLTSLSAGNHTAAGDPPSLTRIENGRKYE